MSRRSTPERIHEARRAATLARLTGEGLSPQRAAAWMDRWAWIASQRGHTRGE
jgi:hypothetical protein